MKPELLRALPKMDLLLARPALAGSPLPYALRRQAARQVLDEYRAALRAGALSAVPGLDELEQSVLRRGAELARPALGRVINATGVVLHTNLGRAPLSPRAAAAVGEAARGYSNLEYDLSARRRGRRGAAVESLLCALTGAEAALVVNNNAAAVVSPPLRPGGRAGGGHLPGELVEIGGGFRVPDILARSGARLVEVGTTNKTRPADYAAALDAGEAQVLLKVHPSNFRVVGFTQAVSLPELGALARERGVPLFCDLGSAAPGSPELAEAVAWADVCCFSGDKLLGGPQAGILLGKAEPLGRLRADPLSRACAPAKLALAALEATLLDWRDGTAVPVSAMLSAPPEELRRRAEGPWPKPSTPPHPCTAVETAGEVGGRRPARGESLPAWAAALEPAEALEAHLRAWRVPILAASTGGSSCWTCASPPRPATRRRSPPPWRRGGRRGHDLLHRGPCGPRQDRPGAGPHRGGHRPAGRGAPPGPHHRAGVRPPGAAGSGAGLPGGRARPRPVHPHHALRLRRAGRRALHRGRRRGPYAPDGGAPGLLSLLGLERGVVALTRADLASPAARAEAEARTRALTAGTFLEGAPRIFVSAVTGEGLEALRAALAAMARQAPPPPEGSPRLHVDRVFSVDGSGTVVTGTLTGGPLRRGDRVQLYPGEQTARVRGLQCHGVPAEALPAGVRRR